MQISRKTPFLARQGLSDLLDNSFKMMGHTWKTSLLLSLVLFLPLSALVGWGTARFFGGLAGLIGAAEEPGLAFFLGYLRLLLATLGASLLLWAAGVFVYAAVGAHVAAVAAGAAWSPGRPPAWRAAGSSCPACCRAWCSRPWPAGRC
jgi:amino acid transporter